MYPEIQTTVSSLFYKIIMALRDIKPQDFSDIVPPAVALVTFSRITGNTFGTNGDISVGD